MNIEGEIEHVIAEHVEAIPVRIVADITENVHDVAARWAPHTFVVSTGMQPFPIAGKNPQRKRLYLWVLSTNTGPVFLSASNTGVPNVAILPGGPPVEMTHTDSVYITTAELTATLYAFEEMYS